MKRGKPSSYSGCMEKYSRVTAMLGYHTLISANRSIAKAHVVRAQRTLEIQLSSFTYNSKYNNRIADLVQREMTESRYMLTLGPNPGPQRPETTQWNW